MKEKERSSKKIDSVDYVLDVMVKGMEIAGAMFRPLYRTNSDPWRNVPGRAVHRLVRYIARN